MRSLSLLVPFALLAACPTPEPKLEDSGADTAVDDADDLQDTAAGDEGDEGDNEGGCAYTSTPIGAEDVVDLLGGTPTAYAAALSGARSGTFSWTYTGATTPLDHALTLDASTALLWEGEWTYGGDGSDTGAYRPDDDVPDEDGDAVDEEDGSGGGSSGGSSDTESEDEPGDTDTDVPDDTGTIDTGGTGVDDEECPAYVTLQGDWAFATGDGYLDEALRVTVRAVAPDVARIEHDVDYAALGGTWPAPELEDPALWDTFTVTFAANVAVSGDAGEISFFASRVEESDGDDSLAVATMGDVGRWGDEAAEE